MGQALHQDKANNHALIALGSNQTSPAGGPEATVRAAIAAIRDALGDIVATSRLFETPCFPEGAGDDFVNAAVKVATPMDAATCLGALHLIEGHFGRQRTQRWGARTLDLDLLAMGEQVLPDVASFNQWLNLPPDVQGTRAPDHLVLPHPRLQDRAFVLVPLCDIAPNWRHPVLGRTATGLLAHLEKGEANAVKPLGEIARNNV